MSTDAQELFGYVGIKAVLDQMQIKAKMMGSEFNIMIIERSSLGKSTMVNTLFKSKVSHKPICPDYEEHIPEMVQLFSITHVVEEKDMKMKLTVMGLGDQINNQNCWEPLLGVHQRPIRTLLNRRELHQLQDEDP